MFAITERLLLRPPWQEDAPAIFEAANDERLVRNLARLPWPYRHADADFYCDMAARDPLPHLLIFDRTGERPRLVGTCGLDETEGRIALGYWIRHEAWNRGYATEAGRALVEIGRALGHRRLTATHFIDNPASGAVLRKIGFRDTGRIEARWSEGRQQRAPARHFEWLAGDIDAADDMDERPEAA